MKRIYSIIILAICTLAFSSVLCAQDKNDDKGFFIGVDGGFASGVSTFKSEKPSLQLNLEGGYRLNKWLSFQLGIGGGKLNIDSRNCCSAHSGINNDRNSYWCSYNDNAWHYYADPKAEGWWYADMTGSTTYYKGAFQINFDLLSFFSKKFGFEISPRVGTMFTKTELSGISSLTGNNLSKKNDTETHFLYGGESTLSYKLKNGISLGIFAAVDMLTGDHFDNIPEHVHKDNYIWDAGVKFVYSLGKK